MNESESKPLQWWTTYWIPLHIGIRIWLANRMPIMDCDEVYNYWEPLHFLLYGSGFQTWEYANQFALRTYSYLMPMLGLAKVYQALIPYLPAWCWPLLSDQMAVVLSEQQDPTNNSNKVALFLLLRSTLAASMAVAEVLFCRSIITSTTTTTTTTTTARPSATTTSIGETVGIVTSGLLLTSAGMSHASGALLPSSTLTFLWLLGATAFLQQQHLFFVTVAVLATLAIGWPFGVLMFVPIGVAILVRERNNLTKFISKIVLITAVIQATVMLIDYQQYQKLVSPVWNILIYNTKAGGDELYGVEPWTYYIKNLLLNFNYVLIGVTGVLPLFVLKQDRRMQQLLILLLPMYAWLLVVAPRPHKEERFLFPIYPCICLGAAMSTVTIVDGLLSWWHSSPQQASLKRRRTRLLWIQLLLWTPSAILSLSRATALAKYYTAPLTVYSKLQSDPDIVDALVCTCGEWYRFPSSFYLPSTIDSFGFVQSSFEGQLPQFFTVDGSGPRSPNQFNDKNLPEYGSYVSLDDCDYLIDLWTSDCRENDFIWKPIAQDSFLDAERTSTLHRTLYLPFLHEQAETQGGTTIHLRVTFRSQCFMRCLQLAATGFNN
ncbi:unnamed protein product [Cylindrotheca closterium]|uniref:Mannosyltransferase n=1 Tax=Cylindrotheca closterium TaxID=2856 RepID=A0AAD2FZF9_9STRA|nr:unnamed protein product [Cylindrotheca closterium]